MILLQKANGECRTNFKRTKSREQVGEALRDFVDHDPRTVVSDGSAPPRPATRLQPLSSRASYNEYICQKKEKQRYITVGDIVCIYSAGGH